MLTQTEAAQAGGVSLPTWQNVESGRRLTFEAKTRRSVAKALRWPPDALDRLARGEEPGRLGPADAPLIDLEAVAADLERIQARDPELFESLRAVIARSANRFRNGAT